MDKKKRVLLLLNGLLILGLASCSLNQTLATDTTSTSASTSSSASTTAAVVETSLEEALAENGETTETVDDSAYDAAEAVAIQLNGDSITTSSENVTVDGSTATITAAGTYLLSGSLADGQIIVDSSDTGLVRLVLNGVDISSSNSAPIYIAKAEKAVIVLADGTENTLSDGETYVFANTEDEEPNAAIFSKSDLTITGGGALTVTGNFNDAINCKDGLVISGGTITARAVDDGIRGKDYLIIQNADLTVTAGSNGLKSDNEEDATLGYILIESGTVNITSGGDAVQAQTDVLVSGGELTITAGGGGGVTASEETSMKGIKAVESIIIDGGTFTIDSADDAIHTNGSLVVNGGTFTLASGDDGMHADTALEINGGDITINQSYEGIESASITINDGNIQITSSDDGVNVAGGNDGSGNAQGFGPGAQSGNGPMQDAFSSDTSSYFLYINGGTITVNAGGDGLDSNGSMEMTGGLVIVNGPTDSGNGALDYNGTFNIRGGLLVAAGSSGMAQSTSQTSTQAAVLINFDAAQSAGTLVHIQNSAGEDVLTFAPTKQFQSILFSSPDLVSGNTYTISLGGSAAGTETSGLYQDGTYTAGTDYQSFTVSSMVTTIGTTSGMGGGRGGGHQKP